MTLPRDYFDDLYARSTDPWSFTERWYEERKRALTLALLPDRHYTAVYEPGCSIGVLTEQLADRCDRLLASDIAPAAVDAARQRVAARDNVTVIAAALPHEWPTGHFDLVVLSELGYYFSSNDAADLASRAFASAATVVAVHWRHVVVDYPISGDEVHEVLSDGARAAGHEAVAQYLDDDVVAAVWSTDPRSVAARTGVR
jgi:hypothetical protein